MFLAVDIGNSRINTAVFEGDSIVSTLCFDTLKNTDSDFYKEKLSVISEKFGITDCAIISVVDGIDKVIKIACDEVFGIVSVILGVKHLSEIKIGGSNPESVGMDRAANVYAVLRHPLPAIVVDIGTAITLDVLNEKKEFLGGVIMPGINMELRALVDGTSKLPYIEPKESPQAIGNTTETCILSGVIRGTASAIDGLLEQCSEELGGCKTVILTGGQAELISKHMKHSYSSLDKGLTLLGIKRIYDSMG